MERLDEILKDPSLMSIKTSVRLYEQEKSRVLVENQKPQTGIYYWIPIGDGKWSIRAFWHEFYGEKSVHAVMWQKFLADEVSDIFGIKSDLKPFPYGLPRGRILQNDGRMILWHGGDSPVSDWKAQVFREFNLSIENCEIVDHSHECSNLTHVEALRKVGLPI